MVACRLLLITVLVVAAVSTEAAGTDIVKAQDRYLCPAELIVLHADANRLHSNPSSSSSMKVSDAGRRGIRNRIAASLASLVWLCRRYVEVETTFAPNEGAAFLRKVKALSRLTVTSTEFVESLRVLIDLAPLPVNGFLINQSDNEDEQESAAIYHTYCHACHSTTDISGENPAWPLDAMAREMDDPEFFARMFLGVRGNIEIGLANPLTPVEIGAMARYFRQAAQ